MADDAEASKPDRVRIDALLRARKDWDEISKRLVLFATKRGCKPAKAMDLAQEAVMRVLDARWVTWDPDKQPDLVLFLQSIINGKLANDRKTARRHREIAIDSEEAERLPDPKVQSAEQKAASGDEFEQRVEALRGRLKDDGDALRLLDLRMAGIDKPAEQAEAMRTSAPEIHKISLRIRYHVEAVKRELAEIEETPTLRRAYIEAAKTRAANPPKRRRPAAAIRRGRAKTTEGEDPKSVDEEES